MAVLAAGLCSIVPLASGCRSQHASNTGRPRIALVMKSLANEFFLTMGRGARAHHAAHAQEYELLASGIKDELDVAAQIGLIEQFVAQQVDAIVLAPADSKSLVAVAKRVIDAGITLVNIDNRLDAGALRERGLRVPFVGPDNRDGARRAAAVVARTLPSGSPIAIIEGVPTAFNAIERRLGFEDAAREAGLRVVASQAGDWDTAKANQVAAAIITEHPEVTALFCANDNMALGALSAVRGAGRQGAIRIVGFDNIAAVRELVRTGQIDVTADQHAGQLAVFGIEYALEILRGKAVPADRETPVDVVTPTLLAP